MALIHSQLKSKTLEVRFNNAVAEQTEAGEMLRISHTFHAFLQETCVFTQS